MTDIHKRINELMTYTNLNFSKFGAKIGVTGVAVSDIVKGKSKPNFKFLASIATLFPEISAEWLLRGEGEMLRNLYTTKEDNMYVRERRATYNSEAQSELIDCQKRIIKLQDELQNTKQQLFEIKLQSKNIIKSNK